VTTRLRPAGPGPCGFSLSRPGVFRLSWRPGQGFFGRPDRILSTADRAAAECLKCLALAALRPTSAFGFAEVRYFAPADVALFHPLR